MPHFTVPTHFIKQQQWQRLRVDMAEIRWDFSESGHKCNAALIHTFLLLASNNFPTLLVASTLYRSFPALPQAFSNLKTQQQQQYLTRVGMARWAEKEQVGVFSMFSRNRVRSFSESEHNCGATIMRIMIIYCEINPIIFTTKKCKKVYSRQKSM